MMRKFEPDTIVQVLYRGDTITSKLPKGFTIVEMGSVINFVVSQEVQPM